MSRTSPQYGARLGDYFTRRQESGISGLPVMSVTMNDSLVYRDDIDRRLESALRPDQHLLVKKGDIAYNMMRMWQGACGLALHDGIVSPAYVVLEPKPSIDSRFAYHWFKSARMIHLFWAYSHGLTEDRLRLYFDSFCEIPASPPSMKKQVMIADLLDVWDEATARLLQLVDVSRARRKAILNSIYGNAKLHATTPLPEGWTSEALGEICNLASGLWEGKTGPLTKVGVIRNTNFTEDGTLDSGDIAFLDVEEKQLKSRTLKRGDIILEKSGGGPEQPVGRVALFDWNGGPYSFSNFTSVLRIKDTDKVDSRYLHHFLHWVYLSGLTQVMQTRSTGIRNLDSDAYKDLLVPIAPKRNQLEIVSLLETEHAATEAVLDQIRLLRIQKIGLLQKLFEDDPLMRGLADLGTQNQITSEQTMTANGSSRPRKAAVK